MSILDLGEESTPQFQRFLPQELWGEILTRLQSPLDIVRFRSICNSWRSILPSPILTSKFPLRIPPPPSVSKTNRSHRFFITETNGYLYRPRSCSNINPMIVVFESSLPRGSFYPCLLYPQFGKSGRIYCFPKVLDLQQCAIHSLFTTAYSIKVAEPATSNNNMDDVLKDEWVTDDNLTSIDKVVLISYDTTNKSTICNPVYARSRPNVDLCVIALTKSGKLYFLSTRSMKWGSIKRDSKFDDIINYGGMLWVIDEIGGAYVLERLAEASLVLTQVVGGPPHDEQKTSKGRLVEASGELYMLVGTRKMRIEAYKKKGREWVRVKGVGDHIFYVMKGLCFSAVAGGELCLSNNDGSTKKGNIVFVDCESFGGDSNYNIKVFREPVLKTLEVVGIERANNGFAVYDFGKGKRVQSSDEELPEMFCSSFFKK